MNGIDEFLMAALGLFFGITVLMLVLTRLERTLSEPVAESERSMAGPQHAGAAAIGNRLDG